MEQMVKIFIDPGHGGHDPGAVANGLREKDIVLDIAKRIEKKLKDYEKVQVKLSRTTDKYISLSQRAKMANDWKADYFVSVHINAGGGDGYEDFIWNGKVSAATIANQNIFNPEMIRATGFRNRGKKRANFLVLRETKMPAILTECGFIDNKSNANKLKQSSFIDKIAQGHVNALVKIFGLKKKKKADPKTSSSNKGKLYKVQVGAFSQKANAERLANELKKKGYDTYIVQQ